MAEVTLRQVRSSVGANGKQRAALATLKLGRIGRSSTMADTPQLRGALAKVGHLVEVDGVTAPRGVAHGSAVVVGVSKSTGPSESGDGAGETES